MLRSLQTRAKVSEPTTLIVENSMIANLNSTIISVSQLKSSRMDERLNSSGKLFALLEQQELTRKQIKRNSTSLKERFRSIASLSLHFCRLGMVMCSRAGHGPSVVGSRVPVGADAPFLPLVLSVQLEPLSVVSPSPIMPRYYEPAIMTVRTFVSVCALTGLGLGIGMSIPGRCCADAAWR